MTGANARPETSWWDEETQTVKLTEERRRSTGARESERFQRRVGAFVTAHNRKIMHRFFVPPREKLKLMRVVSQDRDGYAASQAKAAGDRQDWALCGNGGDSSSVNGLRTFASGVQGSPPTARRTRTFRLNDPVGKEASERVHPRYGICTTIRAKCPAPSKPATNSAKRPETLDAIIWRFVLGLVFYSVGHEQEQNATEVREVEANSSSYLAVFTRGGKESNTTGMKMKAGFA
ncbi:hypothetical protein WN55_10679 [Dufourea novaeangliae]|uniref:Uncharacterized protein n=1 Tax=Dufourea novaeangliae TaxID=178035 RepID=A0A154P988_DUFNO|nr:hypothetical protein WN55_10679 [Dufourea novaeangliae]